MRYTVKDTMKEVALQFHTEDGVFSPQSIDKGTLAMLSLVDFHETDKVLDLGCGYGVVGILAAKLVGSDKVVMVDNYDLAIRLAKENTILNGLEGIKIVKSNGFKEVNEKDFTLILSNPPYHTDFSIAKEFIEKGFNRLTVGGKMFMVTKRDLWYRKKLTSIFGGVQVWNIEDYFVFMSIKKETKYANSKKTK